MPRQKSRHVDDPGLVGRRLLEARTRAGLSQRQLAFPGCSPAYISRIEAGQRIPSLQLLRELGDRLDVSEDYLATGAEPSASPLLEADMALRFDDYGRAEELFAAILADAPSDRERSRALEGLGHAADRAGRPDEAIERFEDALRSAGADAADRPELAEALGRAYAARGEFAAAIDLFRRCLIRVEEEDDPVQCVRFACLLGYALTDAGDFAEAERVVAGALTVARDITDPYTRARLYWSQSRVLLEQGRSELAERYARKTVETLVVTEDSYALAHAYQALAHIYLDLGRHGDALDLLREGWPLLAATGSPVELAHYRIDEARALAGLGETDAALTIVLGATAQLGDSLPVDRGRAYVLAASIFEGVGESERAVELYELAVEILELLPPSRYLIEAYRRLSTLLKSGGRRDEALELLERALRLQEHVGRVLG